MNTLFPMFVKLQARPCLVIGGGYVALRKIRALLESQAAVRVIAPQSVEAIRTLAQEQRLTLNERAYQQQDVHGTALVIAATDNADVNRQIAQDCAQVNILCNVVDCPELSTFYCASVYRCGDLKIAISTNGIAPALARKIKTDLAEMYQADLIPYLKFLQRMREVVKATIADKSLRQQIFRCMAHDTDLLARFQEQGADPERDIPDLHQELERVLAHCRQPQE